MTQHQTAGELTGDQRLIARCGGCSLFCRDQQHDVLSCQLGQRWLAEAAGQRSAICLANGQQVDIGVAIAKAKKLLEVSNLPLVCGLTSVSTQLQSAAIDFARRHNAAIDWTSGCSSQAFHCALQKTGNVSCTLGEIRQRADLLIVWAADPVQRHPRFFERVGKPYVSIDTQPNQSTGGASSFIKLAKYDHLTAIRQLQAVLTGIDLASDLPDLAWDAVRQLADRIRESRYCVFVIDDQLANRFGKVAAEAMTRLVRTINNKNHCRLVHLNSGTNSLGVEETLTWKTGYPFGVVFRDGQAFFRGGEFSVERLIGEAATDLLIVVGRLPNQSLELSTQNNIKAIHLADSPLDSEFNHELVIPIKQLGMDASGSILRFDGVPMELQAAAQSQLPDGIDVMNSI